VVGRRPAPSTVSLTIHSRHDRGAFGVSRKKLWNCGDNYNNMRMLFSDP
jgi:hypothetical protein